MEYNELIKKFNIAVVTRDGQECLSLRPAKGKEPSAEEVAFMKAEKPQIIAFLKEEKEKALKAERENAAATVIFYSTGWESHGITIDTRLDIDEQLKMNADHYPNDCTFESLKEDYERAIAKKAAEKAKAAEDMAAEDLKTSEVFALAKSTGERQLLKRYADRCNDPREECNLDFVSVWAMPDGTTKKIRNHTW